MESEWRWNCYALGVGSEPSSLAARFLARPEIAYWQFHGPDYTTYGLFGFDALEQMWQTIEWHSQPGMRPMPPALYPTVQDDHT